MTNPKMQPGESDADFCRRMGWTPGTRIAGDEGYGVTIIEITGLGEQGVFAKAISHRGEPPRHPHESNWTLSCRDWSLAAPAAPGLREAVIEECAKVAASCELYDGDRLINTDIRLTCAAAIRALSLDAPPMRCAAPAPKGIATTDTLPPAPAPGGEMEPCLCQRCSRERRDWSRMANGADVQFRFACEICGNKRCPHHEDHRFACTKGSA